MVQAERFGHREEADIGGISTGVLGRVPDAQTDVGQVAGDVGEVHTRKKAGSEDPALLELRAWSLGLRAYFNIGFKASKVVLASAAFLPVGWSFR